MVTLKRCFRCSDVLPLTDFYRHPRMTDGHLGKCKECTKADVRANRRRNLEQYQEYDRQRFATDPERRRVSYRSKRRNYPKNRLKHLAHMAVKRAVRAGRLLRQACEVCGSPNAEAHHEDYSRPLDVRWLCFAHHRAEHGQVSLSGRVT